MTNEELLAYSDGSYSVSDVGWGGADQILISPEAYPVPGYLKLYTDYMAALQETDNICALQQGPCWVLKPSQLAPRCGGQPCRSCGQGTPVSTNGGLFGLAEPVISKCFGGKTWEPVARADSSGLSLVKDGCVLPVQAQIWYLNQIDGRWARNFPATYTQAVAAGQEIATRQGKPRVIGASTTRGGTIIPVMYVDPGGIVRRLPDQKANETRVHPMTSFEVQEYFAASRGATLMPFGM